MTRSTYMYNIFLLAPTGFKKLTLHWLWIVGTYHTRLKRGLSETENNPTSYGLRTPNEAFFHQNPKFLGFDRQFWQIYFEAFGVFYGLFLLWYSAESIVHHFYKKLSFLSKSQCHCYFDNNKNVILTNKSSFLMHNHHHFCEKKIAL